MTLLLDIRSFFDTFYSHSHKRWKKWAAIFIMTVFSTAPAAANTILILGDSLSASYGVDQSVGWVSLLQNKLPQHHIINGSVSGETTAGGLRRLPALLDSSAPDLIFIELGGNDGLRGFSPVQLKKNLTKIIQLSKQSGAKVLLSQVRVPPNYGPRYASLFSQVYQDLASTQQVTLVPFFMESIVTEPHLMQRDGIHPNTAAQPLISDFVQPWINAAIQ